VLLVLLFVILALDHLQHALVARVQTLTLIPGLVYRVVPLVPTQAWEFAPAAHPFVILVLAQIRPAQAALELILISITLPV